MDVYLTKILDRFSEHISNVSCQRDPCKQRSFVGQLYYKYFKEPDADGMKAADVSECEDDDADDGAFGRGSGSQDTTEPTCTIIEQNPYAPCCCERAESGAGRSSRNCDNPGGTAAEPPCPPAGSPEDPRVPTCGCDLCQKDGYHGNCCDPRSRLQRNREALHFEKA